MKFFTAALFTFATAAVAAPSNQYPTAGDVTVDEARQKCGNAQIKCCNQDVNAVDQSQITNTGILAGPLSGLLKGNGASSLNLFGQCSELDPNVAVLGGAVSNLLKNQCKSNAACCDTSGAKEQNGIVVNVPCIPVAAL